jgi:hypothetical protein
VSETPPNTLQYRFDGPEDAPVLILGPSLGTTWHMWATAEESRAYVVDLYRRAWAHADATIDALPLDTIGRVPWWPIDRNEVTLHHAVVRVTADTHHHAGHADIVRELLDGSVGMSVSNTSLPTGDPAWWEKHRNRLEEAAKEADRDT